jgi:hypothetical protein
MESLHRDLEEIEATAEKGRHDFYRSLTRAFGLEYARALIGWTKLAERRLSRQKAGAR